MDNNEFKTVCIKNRACYRFNEIIEFEDFDNILLDETSYRNILIYDVQNFNWHTTFMYYVQ